MTPRMSVVGVNLLWLVPGVVGGSEEYTLRLLRAINSLDPEDLWLRLYCRPELIEAYPELEQRFEVRIGPPVHGKPTRFAAENTWLYLASGEDDLLHHAGSMAPMANSRPYVVTVHDIQPLDMPWNFSTRLQWWHAKMLPRALRKAELVLCPSEFSAERVSDSLGIALNKTVVVPHGHEDVDPGPPDDAVMRELAESYGDFVLYPAISYPHKRHIDLIDALDVLRDRFPDLSVVLTGRPGPEADALEARAQELNLVDRVHFLGRVSEDRLDDLYRGAAAMVFPSEYEGFGNPALEAMARGCPVIATTAGALPEVVGDAGLLVEPRRPRALAGAIARVLDEPQVDERLRRLGPKQAEEYGWRDAGLALIGAYRLALRGLSTWS